MMALLVAIGLGTVCLAFVLYPLYRHSLLTVQPGEEITQVAEREQAARTALQEVELDYQLGNISESDYRALRERHTHRALVALKSRYDREQEIDDDIEEQLRQMKERNRDVQ